MNDDRFFIYEYIGSPEIKKSVANSLPGIQIKSPEILKQWIDCTQQKPNHWGAIEATFIVDLTGYLCLADRHSEHIACSGGKGVLSAGEIFFNPNNKEYEVIEISNQSTGFCPQKKSWYWVAKALDRIPLSHPGEFTSKFIFRRCQKCNQLNLIKGNLFICEVCQTKLPKSWNCSSNK